LPEVKNKSLEVDNLNLNLIDLTNEEYKMETEVVAAAAPIQVTVKTVPIEGRLQPEKRGESWPRLAKLSRSWARPSPRLQLQS
jgi:hypothetical protein